MASVVQHLGALKVRLSHRPLYPKPQYPEGTDLAEVWSSSADPTTTRLRFKLLGQPAQCEQRTSPEEEATTSDKQERGPGRLRLFAEQLGSACFSVHVQTTSTSHCFPGEPAYSFVYLLMLCFAWRAFAARAPLCLWSSGTRPIGKSVNPLALPIHLPRQEVILIRL